MILYRFILGMAILFGLTGQTAGTEKLSHPQKGFISWLPAPSPDHAMLLGNGEMGAMVFGHPHQETIIMNHSSLYLPVSEPVKPINQVARLDEIRQLILDGKGEEAAMIPVEISMEEGYGGHLWSDPYIPAFDIKLSISAGNTENYRRYVNYETGEAIVSWKQDGAAFERRQFISRSDSIMIISIKAEKPFDTRMNFERRPFDWSQWEYINNNFKSQYASADNDRIVYHTEFVHQNKGEIAGFHGVGKIVDHDGELISGSSHIEISGAQNILIAVKVQPYITGGPVSYQSTMKTLEELGSDYDRLLQTHKQIHTEMFNRVEFGLDFPDSEPLYAEVRNQQSQTDVSLETIVKRFYASRYNILSATGVTPPNLQGIWGSSYEPPWASDYTHDGNLPVAISSFLPGSMPELMMSFFDYHDARVEDYRENARKLYGCRGIQVPSHTSTYGYNIHFDPIWCLSFWNGGAAWAASFYFDYWLYTNDTIFLKERAWPFMKEAALFWEDFIQEDEQGQIIYNPSYSPENNPLNHDSQATINATMDVMLTRELLNNLISVAGITGEEPGKIQQWEEILEKLPAYEVDSTGALREWLWPGYKENHDHRHLSHLYGIYDRIDPIIAASPELTHGAQRVLEEKIKQRIAENGGIMVFGLVQMAWVAANLGDAEKVETIIRMLNTHYWSDSQATYHDPGGLFNMDLSGGYQTAIIRALVHSDKGALTLLPALPPSWNKGFINGISARGQVTVHELQWEEDTFFVTLESELEQQVRVNFPSGYAINPEDIPTEINLIDNNPHSLLLAFVPGEVVRIQFNKTQ